MTHRFLHPVCVLLALLTSTGVGVATAQDSPLRGATTELPSLRSGRGWSLVRLDVDVTLSPERGQMSTSGVVTLRLDGLDQSYGPDLLVNTRLTRGGEPAIRFEQLSAREAAITIADTLLGGVLHRASVRFPRPLERGAVVEVRFDCRTNGPVRRMIVHDSAAMADWSNAWLPFPLPGEGGLTMNPGLFRVTGHTTLRLPRGWVGLVDGSLVDRAETAGGVVETWDTPVGIARGLVAGPYQIFSAGAEGRRVQVYAMDATSRARAASLAQRLATAMDVLESRFGPFPFEGPYTVVEFPRLPQQSFGAVSEQTHIIVQPPNLEYSHENIQLLAHEVSHAWWGNAVGTGGPATIWVSEGLAEFGAVLAIEALDGREAMHAFLDLARTGTDPYYSAAGYFALMRQGQDMTIAHMGTGAGTHALANSKGVWIFHMLRESLGDSLFFAIIRDIARNFHGKVLAADDLREQFVHAAPSHYLRRFFSQWLDGMGAPVFDLDWHANADGNGLLLRLTQLQNGPPFTFPLDIGIRVADGSGTVHTVTVDSASQIFELRTTARPIDVELDPGHKLLMWRPRYGPRPVREILGPSLLPPQRLVDAVVGRYRFVDFDKPVEVFVREGVLYMRPAGSVAVRLIPDTAGAFRVDGPGGNTVEFDLSTTPAPSFVSVEGGGRERYLARRGSPGDRP